MLFTGVLCLFTGGLWLSTHRLWKSGEKQIAAASIAAAAAQEAADVARATLRTGYRPWISIKASAEGKPVHYEGKVLIDMRLNLENVGTAPAINVCIKHFMIERTRKDVSYNLDFNEVCRKIGDRDTVDFPFSVFPNNFRERVVCIPTEGIMPDSCLYSFEACIFVSYEAPGNVLSYYTVFECYITLSSEALRDGGWAEPALHIILRGEYAS